MRVSVGRSGCAKLGMAGSIANFAFNHNGVTLFAERLDRQQQDRFVVPEPRVLNGAETITTLHRFIESNKGHPRLKNGDNGLEDIRVLCKIITKAKPEFVVTVTINNNRQNPVEPWDLHANDNIQLELQDKLLDDPGIYYERQKNAFENLTQEDMEARGITVYKAMQLLPLAKTYLRGRHAVDQRPSHERRHQGRTLFSGRRAAAGRVGRVEPSEVEAAQENSGGDR